jgi:hypothetical protein
MAVARVATVELVGEEVGETAEPDGAKVKAAPEEDSHERDPGEGMSGRAMGEKTGDEGQEHEVEVGQHAAEQKPAPVDRGTGGVEALRNEVGDREVGNRLQRSPRIAAKRSTDPRLVVAMCVFYQSVGAGPIRACSRGSAGASRPNRGRNALDIRAGCDKMLG